MTLVSRCDGEDKQHQQQEAAEKTALFNSHTSCEDIGCKGGKEQGKKQKGGRAPAVRREGKNKAPYPGFDKQLGHLLQVVLFEAGDIIQVDLRLLHGRIEFKGLFVVKNGKAELIAAECGISHIIIELGRFESRVQQRVVGGQRLFI